jgi:hypothetical protein
MPRTPVDPADRHLACLAADRLVAEIEAAHGQPTAEDVAWAEAVADRVGAALAGRPD